MKKSLVFVALAGMMLAGCNGGGTATKDVEASDSVGVEAAEVVVETVDSEVVTNVEAVADSVVEEKDSHEYVDLGLESGTLWATCNVKAEKPEEYGEYYAWGETETKNVYSEENATLMNMNTEELKSKYGIDANGNLWSSRDVAIKYWKDEWRMPTKEEMKELLELESESAELNGVKGRKFIGKNGNSVFFPYAGFRDKDGLKNKGLGCYYWSATTYGDESCAYCIDIDSAGVNLKHYTRKFGFTIRPVKKKE